MFFLSIASLKAQTLNFTNNAGMSNARSLSCAASDNVNEYVANGNSATQQFTSGIEKYNFATDTWSVFSTSIPTIPKIYGSAEILAGKMYIFNGSIATGINDKIEEIDIATGNVSVNATLNPNPVINSGSAIWGNYIVSFGGCTSKWNANYSNKLYKISPLGVWTQLANMPIGLEAKGKVVYGNGTNSKLYVLGGYNDTNALQEDFQTVATTGNLALTNWFNVTETGTKFFKGKIFSTNIYAEISAYNSVVANQEPSNIAWLVSPNVSLVSLQDTFLTFDTQDAFANGATFEAYIITNWTGDITTSTKTLLSANISTGHTTYSGFINSGAVSLASFSGNFRIAFKYTGGYSPVATTTYQVDNVRIYKGYKSNAIYIYDFTTNIWSTSSTVLPQSISANAIAIDNEINGTKIYLTGDYDNQTYVGEYNITNDSFSTLSQTNMVGRRHHKSTVWNNKLYLFGGSTSPSSSSVLASTQSADLATLGTAQYNNQDLVTFYPNPTTDILTFNYNIKEVTLYTLDGKKMNVTIENNEINVSYLPKGIYLLQGINENGKSFSEKFIKK